MAHVVLHGNSNHDVAQAVRSYHEQCLHDTRNLVPAAQQGRIRHAEYLARQRRIYGQNLRDFTKMNCLFIDELDQSARGRRERRQGLDMRRAPKMSAGIGCDQNNAP